MASMTFRKSGIVTVVVVVVDVVPRLRLGNAVTVEFRLICRMFLEADGA